MAQAFVQSIAAQVTSAAASCTTAAITTTAGNLLVLAGTEASASSFAATPLSDSKTNTWQAAIAITGTTVKVVQKFDPNGTRGASHTFTASTSGSHFPSVVAVELSGMDTSSPLDKQAARQNGSATGNHSSGATAATTQANEIGVGCASTAGGGSEVPTAGSSGNLTDHKDSTAGSPVWGWYRLLTATGTYDCSFTDAPDGAFVTTVGIATYKEAAAGAAQDTPELWGRPSLASQRQMHQHLAN